MGSGHQVKRRHSRSRLRATLALCENGKVTEASRILVVDDEANICDLVATALRYEGFEAATATTGTEAVQQIESEPFDLVVLDVMLPDMDGTDVCRRLRATGSGVPVLFLTARDATEDKVAGLTAGADDYVTKPFSLDELVARVRAVLRRVGSDGDGDGRLAYADLQLDPAAHQVHRAGELIELTATEFRLLEYLMTNVRRVLSKDQILAAVWGAEFDGDRNIVETYISYLRKKIDRRDPELIHTVRGVGYVMRRSPEGNAGSQ